MKRVKRQVIVVKNRIKHAVVITSAFLVVSISAFADGTAGITSATTQVQGYFDVGSKLMLVIGAVIGIIGAIKVYQKWNAGEQDTNKVAASWFGSCVFLVIVTAVLRAFFLT
ncbi:DUF4134 domain-containing protein [Chitinophaga rhizophila]|uniref:DUF4134 domain-containing protein n=1 Tax=Chitinophaga rhizophila TaxID=2866212 RepID=A0ABS7G720_9BACT|nr:DUF4134 domain-containing protein [Chitinophaga rhizophila]MBW8683452.1 DUF4134 domain-containing protein [Chitinophaga rhizophila]